jgi:regulation of enolase protein 1 (concanavalin A-like superfamily)
MSTKTSIAWNDGSWLNRPHTVAFDGDAMIVEPVAGSDFWRRTAYGFVRDTGHALLVPFLPETALEVTFRADFEHLYDQAGMLIRVDEATWIKAGIEITDGEPHVAVVATNELSDWSLAPVPAWQGQAVTVRASRTGDAVTLRMQTADTRWRTIRLAPLAVDAIVKAGPMCCSPERGGLKVTFTRFDSGPADTDLHTQPD